MERKKSWIISELNRSRKNTDKKGKCMLFITFKIK